MRNLLTKITKQPLLIRKNLSLNQDVMLMATIYKSIFIRPIPLLKLIGTKYNDSVVIDKQLVESDDI